MICNLNYSSYFHNNVVKMFLYGLFFSVSFNYFENYAHRECHFCDTS